MSELPCWRCGSWHREVAGVHLFANCCPLPWGFNVGFMARGWFLRLGNNARRGELGLTLEVRRTRTWE